MFQLARDTISEFGCAVTKCGVLTMSDGSELNNMLRIVCYYAHGLASLNTYGYIVNRTYLTASVAQWLRRQTRKQ